MTRIRTSVVVAEATMKLPPYLAGIIWQPELMTPKAFGKLIPKPLTVNPKKKALRFERGPRP